MIVVSSRSPLFLSLSLFLSCPSHAARVPSRCIANSVFFCARRIVTALVFAPSVSVIDPPMHTASEEALAKSRVKSANFRLSKNLTDAADRLADFLRRRHPSKTAAHVAALTGAPLRTVGSWLEGRSAPGLEHQLMIIAAYGPDALAACYGAERPDWLDRAQRGSEIEALRRQQSDIAARLDALRASI